MTRTRFYPQKARRTRPQQGVVLVVVLVLLMAVTFMSVSVLRSSMGSDLLTNNNRTQSLAMEITQAALRFCEDDVRTMGTAVLFTDTPRVRPAVTSGTPMAWKISSNWVGSTPVAKELTEDHLKSASTAIVPKNKLPQCIAEYDPEATDVIVITARGFSPDYTEEDNEIRSGSVVWLQSRMMLSSAGPSGPGGTGGEGGPPGSSTNTTGNPAP